MARGRRRGLTHVFAPEKKLTLSAPARFVVQCSVPATTPVGADVCDVCARAVGSAAAVSAAAAMLKKLRRDAGVRSRLSLMRPPSRGAERFAP